MCGLELLLIVFLSFWLMILALNKLGNFIKYTFNKNPKLGWL